MHYINAITHYLKYKLSLALLNLFYKIKKLRYIHVVISSFSNGIILALFLNKDRRDRDPRRGV